LNIIDNGFNILWERFILNISDIELYPHNQETYSKICEAWKTKNKVAVVQATGTGKTYLIGKCIFNPSFQTKIILAPSNYILTQIHKILGENNNIIFMTYQKLVFMGKKEISQLKASLIILDEFHRCGAEAWEKAVKILLDNNKTSKILGTSATPIRYLDNDRDMSDEIFDGNVVTNLNLSDAIVQGILPIPKYITTLFTLDDEIKKLRTKIYSGDNIEEEKQELTKEVDLMKRKLDQSKGAPSILKKHLKNIKDQKFIVFCRSVEHLRTMINVVPKWFLDKKVIIFKSYSEYQDSDDEFDKFKNINPIENQVALLFSIDMLNEGIHIGNVTGVILLRPTISPNIYYQQIGRAIQIGNRKNNPLIFDFVNNFDNLGTHQFLADIHRSKKEAQKKNKKVIDIPNFLIIDEVQEIKDVFKQIENKIISTWDRWYDNLSIYYKEHGNSLVPKTKGSKNYKLALWISKQRELYRNKCLSEDKIKKLEAVNMVWNKLDNFWITMFNVCKQYKMDKGHIHPHFHEEYKGYRIGNWCSRQRSSYKKGKLTVEKIEKLESIGFDFQSINVKIPPIGYKYTENNKLILDNEDKENVKKIFLIMAESENIDKGKEQVKKWLKENGIHKRFEIN
jgi:superfamily II DNA or RNA helicase